MVLIPEPTKDQLKLFKLKKLLEQVENNNVFHENDVMDILQTMILSGYDSGTIPDIDTFFIFVKRYGLECPSLYIIIIDKIIDVCDYKKLESEKIKNLIALSKYWRIYFSKNIPSLFVELEKRFGGDCFISTPFMELFEKFIKQDHKFMAQLMRYVCLC